MNIFKLIYKKKKSGLISLTKADYKESLLGEGVAKNAFEKAWAIRNFEIELYWKRATYFWTFIASCFVGYFALVNSTNYSKPDQLNHVDVYFLICMGFILSLAWLLTNKGSKSWQRHWEIHIDLLEDNFTGPLHKTVNPVETYSVSKINEIVSFTFISIWFLFGVKYFVEQDLIRFSNFEIDWLIAAATLITALICSSMLFGYGRGHFGERKVTMYRRTVSYNDI